MSVLTKIIGGLLTTSAVGGVAYGAYSYTDTTDTVSNYLTKNHFNVAKQDDNAFWEKVLKTYKLEKTGLEISDKDLSKPSEVKEWCDATLKTKIKSKEEDIFKRASKWCVEYETIKEKLKNKKLVDTPEKLNGKLDKFSEDIQKEINEITVVQEDSNTKGAKVKKWCEDNSYRSYSKDEDKYFKEINAYCLVEGG